MKFFLPQHTFFSLLSPLTPTLFYPNMILDKPCTPFKPYGLRISMQEGMQEIKYQGTTQKAIVIFIGGFCDTFMCAVYREFATFQNPYCLKIYMSFKSQKLLCSWLPSLHTYGYPLFIIAHSWGANNLYKALCRVHTPVHYLLTLDPVGRIPPCMRPKHIDIWENIYISHKEQYLCRTNILAIVGGAWNHIRWSDSNIVLQKPYHHASISPMIEASHFNLELFKIIKA